MLSKKDIFLSTDSFGTSLLICMIDTFGTDCLNWEPETIEMELEKYVGQDVPSENLDRLQAAMSVLTSNLFFISLEAFNVTCNALNFSTVSGSTFIPADIEDIMWGITEVNLLLGADSNKDEFSRDIQLYVGKVLESEGILDPPSILQFADMRKMNAVTAAQVSDLPDLSSMFSAGLADTKAELDSWALKRIDDLFTQIGNIKLEASDKQEFTEMVNRFRTR